jgi:hypothetical protein
MSSSGGGGGLAAKKFAQLFDAVAWDLMVRPLVEREVVWRRLGGKLPTVVCLSMSSAGGAVAAHRFVELFDAAAQDGRPGIDRFGVLFVCVVFASPPISSVKRFSEFALRLGCAFAFRRAGVMFSFSCPPMWFLARSFFLAFPRTRRGA